MSQIPARLDRRPATAGLVHPWVNVALADGGCDYRSPHHARWQQAWQERRCQTCGDRLDATRCVLLAGPNQLDALLFDEPATHPECAAYAADACPMVGGRMLRYADRDRVSEGQRGKTCPTPGCDCDGWTPTPGTGGTPGGDPAHAWHAVWVRYYTLAASPSGKIIGGAVHPDDVLRVRLVSTPAEGRVNRALADDEWRGLVTAPAVFTRIT